MTDGASIAIACLLVVMGIEAVSVGATLWFAIVLGPSYGDNTHD